MKVRLFSNGIVPIESEIEHLDSLVVCTDKDLSGTHFLNAVDATIAHSLNLALVVDGVVEDLEYIQVASILTHNNMYIIYSAHTTTRSIICELMFV